MLDLDIQIISFVDNNEDAGCGGLFQIQTEVKGNISFWHPANYDNDMNCEWYMKLPPGSLFLMSFAKFNLEAQKDKVCLNDYVLIRGSSNTDTDVLSLPILAKHCGSAIPPGLLVHARHILIRFHSNLENNYRGFIISYSIIKEIIPN